MTMGLLPSAASCSLTPEEADSHALTFFGSTLEWSMGKEIANLPTTTNDLLATHSSPHGIAASSPGQAFG